VNDPRSSCRYCGQPINVTYGVGGSEAALTFRSSRQRWKWFSFVIWAAATVGSVVAGFLPGWGPVLAVACTLGAIVPGFKAVVMHHTEITR